MQIQSVFLSQFGSVFLASIPGILVALVAQYLSVRHDQQTARNLTLNAMKLLTLEISSNWQSLQAFWKNINALDSQNSNESVPHLSAMAENGLIGRQIPDWETFRWTNLPSEAFAGWAMSRMESVDHFYRDLASFTKLHKQLTSFTQEEKDYYFGNMGGRFWHLRFGEDRSTIYDRLKEIVSRLEGEYSALIK